MTDVDVHCDKYGKTTTHGLFDVHSNGMWQVQCCDCENLKEINLKDGQSYCYLIGSGNPTA